MAGINNMEAGDIVRIELVNDKPIIFFEDRSSVKCESILTQLEVAATNGFFFRIHPKHLINLCHLSKIQLGENPLVIMTDGSELPVDVSKQSELLYLFENHLK